MKICKQHDYIKLSESTKEFWDYSRIKAEKEDGYVNIVISPFESGASFVDVNEYICDRFIDFLNSDPATFSRFRCYVSNIFADARDKAKKEANQNIDNPDDAKEEK